MCNRKFESFLSDVPRVSSNFSGAPTPPKRWEKLQTSPCFFPFASYAKSDTWSFAIRKQAPITLCALYVSFHSPTSILFSAIISEHICVSLRLLNCDSIWSVLCPLATGLTSNINYSRIYSLVGFALATKIANLGLRLRCPTCQATCLTLEVLQRHMDSHDYGSYDYIHQAPFTTIACSTSLISSALQAFGTKCLGKYDQALLHRQNLWVCNELFENF